MKTTISVAMTTLNGEDFIEEQLNSILDQTLLPDEVIIFDDGSKDKTLELLENFRLKAPFKVKIYINEITLGYTQNFNLALQQCTGDYVFICDQDDVWLSNKIEVVSDYFDRNMSSVLIIHDLEYCTRDLTPFGETKIRRMAKLGNVSRDYVVGMATAIRGDFLRICLPIPNTPGISYDRWLHSCADVVGGKYLVPEVLALYRRHGANATAEKVVNSISTKNQYKLLWRLFLEPSTLKALKFVPPSPLTSWIRLHREKLIRRWCVDSSKIDSLIEWEEMRNEAKRSRNELLQLPHYRRIILILNLYRSGAYNRFYSWRSLLKDLLR